MKLYYSTNLNPRVAVAVAKYLKSPVEFIKANPFSPVEKDEFLKLNPNNFVPVLEEDNGNTLWETDAIACRLSMLAGSQFWRTDNDMPEMIKWISWGTQHLTRAAGPYYFEMIIRPRYMGEKPNLSVLDLSYRDFRHYIGILNKELEKRKWLVGNEPSYADFRVATSFPFAEDASLPLEEFPNVFRLHKQLMELDAWNKPFEELE